MDDIRDDAPLLKGYTFISALVDSSWLESFDDEFLTKVGSIAFDQMFLALEEAKKGVEAQHSICVIVSTQILFLLSKYSPTVNETLNRAGLGNSELIRQNRPIQDFPNYPDAVALSIEKHLKQGGGSHATAEKIAKKHFEQGERREQFFTSLNSLIGAKKARQKRSRKIDLTATIIEFHLLKRETHKLEDIKATLADEYSVSERTIENYAAEESSSFDLYFKIDQCIDPVLTFLRNEQSEPSTLFWALYGVIALDEIAYNITETTRAIHEPLQIELDVNPILAYSALRLKTSTNFLPISQRAVCQTDCVLGCTRYIDLNARTTCSLFNSER